MTVALNRPPANVIDEEMAQELRAAAREAAADCDVWVVLLTAVGESFSIGSALDREVLDSQKLTPSALQELLAQLQLTSSILTLMKPVVCAINGDALGQGLELALACDIRLASAQARLGFPQVAEGLMPWDGGTQLLPRLAGRGRALELLLTGRLLTAEEAKDMGLVSRVVPPGSLASEGLSLAQQLATAGPIAAQYTKEAIAKGMDMTLERGLRLEADLAILLQSTADRAEGVRSFLERRKPSFKGS